jgi:nucleoside-diphosphate-sugar epimerase
MARQYLVTGASGFVGRELCRQLAADGHRVCALLRRPASGPWQAHHCCDLSCEPLPDGLFDGIDGIFHLAGIAHVADTTAIPAAVYHRVNVEATRGLLTAALRAGVAGFVYLSSVKAVAEPGPDCVDETWDAPPEDAYGRSKRAAEALVLAAAGGLHGCVLRPTLVYGPHVKGNLRRMIDAVAAGRFPPIPEFHNRRSLVGVGDLASAARLAMTSPAAGGRTYIVSDGIAYSTRTLYEAILAALGRAPPRWHLPAGLLRAGARLGDLLEAGSQRRMPLSSPVLRRLAGSACYRADALRAELGWEPTGTFFDAVADMVGQRR